MTREHYISADILRSVGSLTIGGMPWQTDPSQMAKIGINALVAKVLCQRHNFVLSPLDAEAGRTFRAILEFQEAQENPLARLVDEFRLSSGPRLELWRLKTLLAMWAAPVFQRRQRAKGRKLNIPNLSQLLQVLFEGQSWNQARGLYIIGDKGNSFRARDLEVVPHCVDGETLTGLTICFRHVVFELVLGFDLPPWHQEFDTVWRPGGLIFHSVDSPAYKLLAIGWPDDNHPHRLGTYFRPGVVDRETGERVQ